MFRCFRYQVKVVKKQREISKIFSAERQPFSIQSIDAFTDSIVGTEVSDDGAASARDHFGDYVLRIIRHGRGY